MIHNLTDLDELLQKVRRTQSRNYIQEAVTAYRASAYRAATTMTWIAVCTDILEKIRELSLDGNTNAKIQEDKLSHITPNNVSELLKFENNLLKIAAEELKIITSIERKQLDRIRTDRNTSAHPTFNHVDASPNILPETVRAHIVSACRYLLTQEPIRGKVLIERIINLIKSDSFPRDLEKVHKLLANDRYLGRAQPVVHRNLSVCILKDFFSSDASINKEVLEKNAFALKAISKIDNQTFRSVIQDKLSYILAGSDETFKRLFILLHHLDDIASSLDTSSKIRISTLIKNLPPDDLINYKVCPINDETKSILIERIEAFDSDIQRKILSSIPQSALKELAIDRFINSTSFWAAQENGKICLLQYSRYLDENDIEKIFQSIIDYTTRMSVSINQILGAIEIPSILTAFYLETKGRFPKAWQKFWDALKSIDPDISVYSDLKQELIRDRVIIDS